MSFQLVPYCWEISLGDMSRYIVSWSRGQDPGMGGISRGAAIPKNPIPGCRSRGARPGGAIHPGVCPRKSQDPAVDNYRPKSDFKRNNRRTLIFQRRLRRAFIENSTQCHITSFHEHLGVRFPQLSLLQFPHRRINHRYSMDLICVYSS